MRRVLFAMLMALITPLVFLTPPASAAVVPTRPRVLAEAPRPLVDPTVRALVDDAVSMGMSVRELRAEWQDVAICEVGGNWTMTGPRYSGIGFSNATWSAYGGEHFAPLAGEATVIEQIVIGMRVTRGWIPDQNGCDPGGW